MPAAPAGREILGGISLYSICIVAGILVALFFCVREEKRLKLPKDTLLDATLWAVPLGIIGARLYYVAFTWELFAANPIRILYIWEGGLAIYGGVIGGAIGVLIVSRLRKVSFAVLVDIIAPSLVLAQAIGRWGNYFNMEAFGQQVTNPALQFFPFAVQVTENGVATWHMATFFYESCWDVLSFFMLRFMRKRKARDGDVLLWYVLLYGAGRCIIEGLRTDSLMTSSGGFRVSQWLSIAGCGVVLLYFLVRLFLGTKNRGALVTLCAMAPLLCFVVISLYDLLVGEQVMLLRQPFMLVIMALLAVAATLSFGKGRILYPLPMAVLSAGLIAFGAAAIPPPYSLGIHTLGTALHALWFPAAALPVYRGLLEGKARG